MRVGAYAALQSPAAVSGITSNPAQTITAQITLPNGAIEHFELHDQGGKVGVGEDDTPGDGIFSGNVAKHQARRRLQHRVARQL